jgi:nucleoside 2-deoxyribosyltransferase
MKKIFITASFQNGENKNDIENLCTLVRQAGWQDFCFIRDVENYQKIFNNPKDLMQRAFEEIKKSDALLIDITEKPTGRAIEAGMAYALGKEIIVIMKKGTVVKDTVMGIADKVFEYEVIDDITEGIKTID